MIEIRRIADSNDFEAQQLIGLHGETFPQYERFHGTSLLAELIDNARAMHFNAVYEDGVRRDFSIIGIWETPIIFISLQSIPP